VRKARGFLLPAAGLLILLIGSAVAYTFYLRSSCDVKAVEESSAVLLRQRNRYDHSYQFAVTAARDAIVRPVAELQQIMMDTQDVTVPRCLQTAKQELVGYMGTVIQAFFAYGSGEADTSVRDLIDQSQGHYDNFGTELEVVKECAPFCFR
jgi:hypothetical protein